MTCFKLRICTAFLLKVVLFIPSCISFLAALLNSDAEALREKIREI